MKGAEEKQPQSTLADFEKNQIKSSTHNFPIQ